MKRTLPLIIVITFGFLFVGYTFIPHQYSQDFYDWYMDWIKALSPFGVILGIMSITMAHTARIQRRVANWPYSLVTLLGLYFTAASGFIWGTQEGTPYMWIFKNIQMPMGATMFALLAFYIASAAYKAFRARSAEATVLLVAAVIVMLGQVPIGITIFGEGITDLTQWILDVPNLASKRGIALGVGLGMVATSLRILLGIERTYLGGGE
ncbi:MAG: hypothetical protein PHY08_04540 [Candidatus Cloacimonetes bacterium]|jgi:hypothetical protein|nr:hypothetical protein [Candidatus Cloacimonadota bacterium]MDD4155823.1 hypothetical protein [Candidatus Cloacimonadota bacterium]